MAVAGRLVCRSILKQRESSGEVKAAGQVRDAHRLVAPVRDERHLDDVLASLVSPRHRRNWLRRNHLHGRADAGTDHERRGEADAVEAVVEAGCHALDRRHRLGRKQVGEAERQVAVHDWRSERRALLARVVRVDPLGVARRERERVHPVLRHLEPAARADLLPHHALERRAVDGRRARGPAAVVDAQRAVRRESADIRALPHRRAVVRGRRGRAQLRGQHAEPVLGHR
mmetsp:Transcript_6840/g.16648  ORF Transcript_6840/g.16648 Transcript_6840/m.16648 type:complete len:229 (-) Transcript_6840:119-805(-)